LRKRVRVIAIPKGIENAKQFIQAVIAPVTFKEMEITPDEIIINAGSENKAALLGRNKRQLNEMKTIVKDFFKVEYRII